MFWVIFIIIIIIGIYIIIGDTDEFKKRIRTPEGDPKIDLDVIKCDNVPQGLEAEIAGLKDGLRITSMGYQKFIPYDDVIEMSIESANQIVNNQKFSVGKAIAGTAVFGSAGAVAGLSGKKDLKMLVISYKKDYEVDYMLFLQKTKGSGDAFLLKKIYDDIKEVMSKHENSNNV